jgi:hypothetical protein
MMNIKTRNLTPQIFIFRYLEKMEFFLYNWIY